MLSHGHIIPRSSNSSFPYYLTNYTENNFDTEIFSKKTRKATKKTAPASAAYAQTIHGKYIQFLSP